MTKVLVVDDDQTTLQLLQSFLRKNNYEVSTARDSEQAWTRLEAVRPDIVILDIMLPGGDGLELCQRIREHADLRHTTVLVVSSRSYEADRRRAKDLGADHFLAKPVDLRNLRHVLMNLGGDSMTVQFWGVRGTLPRPGKDTLRYGGNCNCVAVQIPDRPLQIFDGGTGIMDLGQQLMASSEPVTADIYVSHAHWDHINALPFFAPFYRAGNRFVVHAPRNQDTGAQELVTNQMTSLHFPVTSDEFKAQVSYRDLAEETIEQDGFTVTTHMLNHPGNTLGYRIDFGGMRFAYVTDHEIFPADHPRFDQSQFDRLVEFVRDCQLLVTDTTYSQEQYPNFIGWGHSATNRVADLAAAAAVKTLAIYHHDPSQNDRAIDRKLSETQERLKQLGAATECIAPEEGGRFLLSQGTHAPTLKKTG